MELVSKFIGCRRSFSNYFQRVFINVHQEIFYEQIMLTQTVNDKVEHNTRSLEQKIQCVISLSYWNVAFQLNSL